VSGVLDRDSANGQNPQNKNAKAKTQRHKAKAKAKKQAIKKSDSKCEWKSTKQTGFSASVDADCAAAFDRDFII